MKFIEAPQFGGPEVLTVVETETPTPGEGMLLVEVKAARSQLCRHHGSVRLLPTGSEGAIRIGI